MSLLTAPKDVPAEVWTRMPDEYRVKGTVPAWGAVNKPGKEIDCFLEGPSFDRDGNLYVVDIPYGRIFRISEDKNWTLVCEYDGWPNGLKIHKDGRIFIADYKNGICLLAPQSGRVTAILGHRNSEGFKGVNDLHFDRCGGLYFTDQGQTGMHDPTGRVYRFDMEKGLLNCLIGNGPSPNGLALTPAEDALFVAMTRANEIWRLPLLPDGSTSKVGVFARLAGGVSGPDGLAVNEAGWLTVCDAGRGCAWTFDEWGDPVHRIQPVTGGRTITNLAYGGPKNKKLFMTESDTGNILCADLEIPGQKLFSHR